MAEPLPLQFIFYIAGTPEKVWEGFVSPQSNRIIFSGAELEADLKPGGYLVRDLTASPPSTLLAKSCSLSRRSSCSTPSHWVRVRKSPASP